MCSFEYFIVFSSLFAKYDIKAIIFLMINIWKKSFKIDFSKEKNN